MSEFIKLFNSHNDYESFLNSNDFVKPNVSYCKQENEVHYSPLRLFKGHEYIDLKLPSGTLWATMNVGATSPKERGLLFQWGDTSGYTFDQVGSGSGMKQFAEQDYKYYSSTGMTKYNSTDGLNYLFTVDDPSEQWNDGSSLARWSMPSVSNYNELIQNTTISFNQTDNVYEFTSKNNGEKLIMPFGYAYNGQVVLHPSAYGNMYFDWLLYPSDELNSDYTRVNALDVYTRYHNTIDWYSVDDNMAYRYYGLQVRPIVQRIGPTDNY